MKIGRNDPYPCGSGKKYKFCHNNKELDSGDSNVSGMTLFDRNLILLDAVSDIFGLNKKKFTWDELKRKISAEQIKELYSIVGYLWPSDTNILSLLPKPDNKLRALYSGDVRPEMITQNIDRFGLYSDEILIINPFFNPWCLGREYNPLVNPDQYKSDTLKLIYFMVKISPWLKAGIVKLIPDPCDFDYPLRKKTWGLAEERLKDWKPNKEDLQESEEAIKEDYTRVSLTLPKYHWEGKLRYRNPGMSDEEIKNVLDYMDKQRREDPFAVDQTVGELGNGQLIISRSGANLEMILYICQLTGAFPYTNIRHRWHEILKSKDEMNHTSQIWSPLTKAFQNLEFKFLNNVDSNFAYNMRSDGRLESFRSYLRKLWFSIDDDSNRTDSKARDFSDELHHEFNKVQSDWKEINKSLIKNIGTSVAGGIIGGAITPFIAAGFTVKGVVDLLSARSDQYRFRKTVPLSVFIDLNKHKPK